MFDINGPLSILEQQIIDCLKKHGELQREELESKLGAGRRDLFYAISWLLARGLLNYRKVEGIGKYPAIATWGLKFFLLEEAAVDLTER